MKILLIGATGLVGKELGKVLSKNGHELVVLSRNHQKAQKELPFPARIYAWDYQSGLAPKESLQNLDAVINLAGENIAGARWDKEVKKRIYNSRVTLTKKLMESLAQNGSSYPGVIISASAVGIYGSCGEKELTETSPHGDGFLANLCRDWEAALFQKSADNHKNVHCRKVALRIGVVLAEHGGAFKEMLQPFQLGLSGRIGSGNQYMSWIHIQDLVKLIHTCATDHRYVGVVNAVAPAPITNADLTHILSKKTKSAAFFHAPAFVLKVALGEMSSLLLTSAKVLPKIALKNNFEFQYPDLSQALSSLLPLHLEDSHLMREQWIPHPVEKVFSFFSDAKNLEASTPDWLQFKIQNISTPHLQSGTTLDYCLKIHGFWMRWQTLILDYKINQMFSDTQRKGPYKKWFHVHTFESLGNGTLMRDHVSYQIPVGFLGKALLSSLITKDLNKIFDYRRDKILEILNTQN